MTQINYDKIIHQKAVGERIDYGLIFGNEKIVFIKCGAGGSIKGYQDNYIKLAHRIHLRIGATVIVSSNPDVEHDLQISFDKTIISASAAFLGLKNHEVCFVGTSDGGYYVLLLAKHIPESVKYLGINPSTPTEDKFIQKIKGLPQLEKFIAYGTEDELFDFVPKLQASDIPNLEIKILDGIDHEFTDKVDEFIGLTDLI